VITLELLCLAGATKSDHIRIVVFGRSNKKVITLELLCLAGATKK
jgi:hypothetical protein